MNNVVQFNAYAAQSQPGYVIKDEQSPIMFHAYERPLFYHGRDEIKKFQNTGYKALVRVGASVDEPVCLNVVQETYKVVQNRELFNVIEAGLRTALGDEADECRIVDKVAYGGRTCSRQYVFDRIGHESPDGDRITFRVIALNGFGGSAIKLYSGAIDGFCTNGMIFGDFVSEYAKHTSGLKIARFEEVVKKSVDVFWKNREFWSGLKARRIKDEGQVLKWLEEKFGERLAAKLFRQFQIEKNARGGSHMWALYSALTFFASHPDGEFTLRETKNDHAAATMLKRENDVRSAVNTEEFMKLGEAA